MASSKKINRGAPAIVSTAREGDGNLALTDLGENSREEILNHLQSNLDALKPMLVNEVYEKLQACMAQAPQAASLSDLQGSQTKDDWVAIESLSALRAVVGGRFQQLKERWVEAGFPLREHRGDRQQSAEFNEAGWVELSRWIVKQGFEVRRAQEGEEFFFKIRIVIG